MVLLSKTIGQVAYLSIAHARPAIQTVARVLVNCYNLSAEIVNGTCPTEVITTIVIRDDDSFDDSPFVSLSGLE